MELFKLKMKDNWFFIYYRNFETN